MEEVKKVNTEHFKKKIGNTTYRVRVHFPQNTKRTFTRTAVLALAQRQLDAGVEAVGIGDRQLAADARKRRRACPQAP